MEDGRIGGRALKAKRWSWSMAVLLVFGNGIGWATAHLFVWTDEGIWVASDSLNVHTDPNGSQIATHVCKTAVSKNRIVMNTGNFRSLEDLLISESHLPSMTVEQTSEALMDLIAQNHMLNPSPPPNGGDPGVRFLLATFDHGKPTVKWGEYDIWTAKRRTQEFQFRIGVLGGSGIPALTDEAHERSLNDPEYRKKIEQDPKKELTALLDKHVQVDRNSFGPPYSVLLLRPDGTILDESDKSDEPLCTIPADAQYKAPQQ
jgi:hypothetical protein